MITETQIVVTCVLVVVVAVVSWCAAAWWTAGRYEEEIRGLEDELELRRPFGSMPREIAHEIAADAVAFGEHVGQALAVVREDVPLRWPFQPTTREDAGPFIAHPPSENRPMMDRPAADLSLSAWTRAQGEELAAYVDSLIEESKRARYQEQA